MIQQRIELNTMIPACFSNPSTLSSTSPSHQASQNLITCIYQTQLCNSPTYLTLIWSKTLSSHSLTLYVSDSFSITISLNPSTFSFFRSRSGSKSVNLTHTHHHHHHHHCQRIKLYWDFTQAKFHQNSAEPDSSFYLAVACDSKVQFFIGDLQDELTRRSGLDVMTRQLAEPALLSRREHAFGSRNYVTRAQFMGSKHDIEVECRGGVLSVRVDGELSLVVKRLTWKFRGNEKIYVGGVEVDFFWDVFNWVNDGGAGGGGSSGGGGHGVFVFQVGDGGVWPEMVGPEKRLMRKSSAAGSGSTAPFSPAPSCSSVLQWAEESSQSSDCGRSSSSSSRSCGSNNGGFSLLLYAWRKD